MKKYLKPEISIKTIGLTGYIASGIEAWLSGSMHYSDAVITTFDTGS